MGKVSFLIFAFVKHTCFDFAFSAVTKLHSGCPFAMVEKFAIGFQTDYVVLVKVIQF